MAGPFDPYHRWLGIPPKDQPPNHYRLLGLELFEDDADVIQSAADQRMAHLRTFQTGKHGSLSQTLLNEVAAAKICLLRPQKRAAYDELLRQQLQPKPVAASKPRAEEPADSQLADFVTQADRGMPAVRPRVAARRKTPKLGLLLGAVAVAGVVALSLILRSALSTAETALVLDWPEDQRKGATLQVDGESFVVESSGPLQHRCGPGEHRIQAARPGFEPFVKRVTLEQGQTKTVHPVWQKAAEKGPPPPAPPLAGADKIPPDNDVVPDKPAETPSDGTTSVAGPPTPPVEPGDGSPQEKPGSEPPKVAAEPGVGEPEQQPLIPPTGRHPRPNEVKRWDPANVGLRGILPRDTGEFIYLAFSPDGATLFAGNTSDVGVEYWDANAGQPQGALPGRVGCVALSANASMLAFADTATGAVKLRNMTTGKERPTQGRHEGAVHALAVSPDGAKVASAGHDKMLMLWNSATGKLLWSHPAHEYQAHILAFSPDGSTLASGCASETYPGVKLWDVTTGKLRKRLSTRGEGTIGGGIRTFAFSPDGSLLASSEVTDNAVSLWDVAKAELLRKCRGHTAAVISLAFSPDGATLASGSDDKTVRLWDTHSGQLVRTLQGYTTAPKSLVFSPDGINLATTDHQSVKLWGPPRQQP